MNFLDTRTDNVEYLFIHKNVFDGHFMNMYLVLIEGNCGTIDSYDYTCHGYYIIKFS